MGFMHLLTIIAFAALILEADDPGQWRVVDPAERALTLLVGVGPFLVLVFLGWLVNRRGLGLLASGRKSADHVHQFLGRSGIVLRLAATIAFVGAVFLTNWGSLFGVGTNRPGLQILNDLVALLPYALTLVLLWVVTYPAESALREREFSREPAAKDDPHGRLNLRRYLDFNIRHHLLVVGVPMTLILVAADVIRAYETELGRLLGLPWAGDIMLGAVAAVMFVVAPLILVRIWRTESLPAGPLRRRLERICERIGLRCRDILIWKSDGTMINAAVMGLIPGVRYVMLSDALLETMTDRQVEAVFGHEAGHICRRHIQRFLVFAFVGWLFVAGLMEGMAVLAIRSGHATADVLFVIQGFGVVATLLFWGIGFGMLSRRFERQADLFGARCVAANGDACTVPCSVHLEAAQGRGADAIAPHPDRVCATGAEVFASALDRVALLNGIPHEERSWRHSSIGSRIRLLMALAGDPALAERFERSTRRVNRLLLAVAVTGAIAVLVYWVMVSMPAILRLQAGQL